MLINDLRKIICLTKSKVSVERISFCDVIGNLVEHGIHCLPCSYMKDVQICHCNNYDIILMHTCDTFQRGIREVFLSFPGGF